MEIGISWFSGCLSDQDVKLLWQIKSIAKKERYIEIFEIEMIPYTKQVTNGNWIFQRDNDPKLSSRVVQNCLYRNTVNSLSKSGLKFFNSIERLRQDLKSTKNFEIPRDYLKYSSKSDKTFLLL